HIQDDQRALNHFHDALVPGGHAIVLVPAHPWLYTACDETLGHFRRYTPDELRERMEAAGFDIVSLRQFNRLGVAGWWVSGKLGKKDLSPFQMRAYELLLPVAKLLDRIGAGPGLSLIAVGRKPADGADARPAARTVQAALPDSGRAAAVQPAPAV